VWAPLRSPPWQEVDFWALDLETSGLDAQRDAILSVGMVPIRQGTIRWGERFYSLVKPPRRYPLNVDSLRVHHILPEEVEHAPALPRVMGEVRRRLREGPLIVHYGKLDLRFLRLAFLSLRWPWHRPTVIDTLHLLGRLGHRRRLIGAPEGPPPADLARARKTLDLPFYIQHHALHDALATAELFLLLCARLELRTLRQIRH